MRKWQNFNNPIINISENQVDLMASDQYFEVRMISEFLLNLTNNLIFTFEEGQSKENHVEIVGIIE